MEEKVRVDILIPTYRPEKEFGKLLDRLYGQTYPIHNVIIMNTEKQFWNTDWEKGRDNLQVHHITKSEFDHGKTRRQGARYATGDILVCMTQDAMPRNRELLEKLIQPLWQPKVAASYARQVPARDAHCIESFTRRFNYPDENEVKWREDLSSRGIKTYFCSNVCAAYDREIYVKQGGFIPRAIFNEDMIYGAGLIQAGYGIAYAADAQVIHSHNYNCRQQFHRNFDLGVSQAEHPEIFADVPSEGAGIALVKATARYLLNRRQPWLLPKLIAQSGSKYLGYQLGKHYRHLPSKWIQACTMNPEYWKGKGQQTDIG